MVVVVVGCGCANEALEVVGGERVGLDCFVRFPGSIAGLCDSVFTVCADLDDALSESVGGVGDGAAVVCAVAKGGANRFVGGCDAL